MIWGASLSPSLWEATEGRANPGRCELFECLSFPLPASPPPLLLTWLQISQRLQGQGAEWRSQEHRWVAPGDTQGHRDGKYEHSCTVHTYTPHTVYACTLHIHIPHPIHVFITQHMLVQHTQAYATHTQSTHLYVEPTHIISAYRHTCLHVCVCQCLHRHVSLQPKSPDPGSGPASGLC